MIIIEKSTLAKTSDTGELIYVYPKTSADHICYDENSKVTVKDKLEDFDNKINKVLDEIGNMTYEALSIKSFTVTPSYIEKGNIIESITFNFNFNRVPKSIQIKIGSDIYEITNTDTSFTVNGLNIKSPIQCILTAYDNNNGYATKTINLKLCRRYFYGAASVFDKLNSLTNTIKESKNMELTINAESGNYIYFCCPINKMDDRTVFNVGGFEGGFSLVGITYLKTVCNESSFDISNDGIILSSFSANDIINTDSTSESSYETTQTYAIYKSDNAGLGNTTFKVS